MEINYSAVLPEIILSLTGVLLMLLVPSLGRQAQGRLGYIALLGLGGAFLASISQWGAPRETAFFGMVFHDPFAAFTRSLFILMSLGVVMASLSYLRREKLQAGEFFALLLFATTGMCFMASSADLIMTFLGLETLSIATYVLAAFRKHDVKSVESSWKYFILGAFSTAFMLYGIAFIYGSVGSTRYLDVGQAILTSAPGVIFLGIALLLTGFGFKVAATPFHVWAPDVYQGAPLPVTAHLAVGSKAAAFVALVRVFQQMVPSLQGYWGQVFWTGAVLTMVVGNVAALSQTNLKRLLAYSSIAHAGYLLIGMTAGNSSGVQAMLFYLSSYALMTIGAFTVLSLMSGPDEEGLELRDCNGLAGRAPFLSVTLAIFLVSMAGIPATAGFMGKFFLFSAAIEKRFYLLVVVAVITSAIALYYYLRIIVAMFMKEYDGSAMLAKIPLSARTLILVLVIGTLFLGLFPGPLLDLAEEAVRF